MIKPGMTEAARGVEPIARDVSVSDSIGLERVATSNGFSDVTVTLNGFLGKLTLLKDCMEEWRQPG